MALYLRRKLENKAEIAVWQITETEKELMNFTTVTTRDEKENNKYALYTTTDKLYWC